MTKDSADDDLLDLDQLRDAWNRQADAANSWDELGVDEMIAYAQQQALNKCLPRPASVTADGEQGMNTDPIRIALERLTLMASDEIRTSGLWNDRVRAAFQRLTVMLGDGSSDTELWAHSTASWERAIAAARAALAAAPQERQAAIVPGWVPVSQRPWEREGWCDEQGRCWLFIDPDGWHIPCWGLARQSDYDWGRFRPGEVCFSLPAHALPLPSGERQAAPAIVPVPVSERLPELRGMFERILCVASSDQKPVGHIQLADQLIKALVSWGGLQH